MKRILLKIFVTFIIFGETTNAIDGGRKATLQEIGSLGVVAIVTKRPGGKMDPTCTGVRIAPDYVVTADHCVGQNELTLPYISDNTDPRTGPYEKVESVIFFKRNYVLYRTPYVLNRTANDSHGPSFSDIAILKLKKKNMKATTVKIGTVHSLKNASEIIQIGYGRNVYLDDYASDEEWDRSFEYPYYGIAHLRTGGIFTNLQNTKFDFHTDKSGVQGGDSGGPLLAFVDNKLEWHGILSSAGCHYEGNICTRSATYTHPSFYVKWLRCATNITNLGSEIENELPTQILCGDSGELQKKDLLPFYDSSCRLQALSEGSPLKNVDDIMFGFDLTQLRCAPMNSYTCEKASEVFNWPWDWENAYWDGNKCLIPEQD